MSDPTASTELDISEILQHLPHRYPFLLVDRVLSCEPGKRLKAIKNVTINEHFFQGHFPGRPVMPGVLLLEALAQATGILGVRTMEKKPAEDEMYFFVGIDNARFKQPVRPGDQILLDVEFIKERRKIWKFYGQASVDGQLVTTADLLCTHRSIDEIRR